MRKFSIQSESVAGIAQLVERNLAKVEVEGSSPFSRSKKILRQAKYLPFFMPMPLLIKK
jgi:hypothetical protein